MMGLIFPHSLVCLARDEPCRCLWVQISSPACPSGLIVDIRCWFIDILKISLGGGNGCTVAVAVTRVVPCVWSLFLRVAIP